ncbi:MAG: hypothetical protein HQK55_04765 [Deltaproteobacteria bacterium]|nr:hypothetical protein [Deltaproteobacteria bacterium]
MKLLKNRPRRVSWLALETVIIIGLSLKLILSLSLLLWNHPGEQPILQTTQVMAAETKPAAKQPADQQPAAKQPAAQKSTASTNEAPASSESKQYQVLLESIKARETEVIRKEQILKDRETALKVLEKQVTDRLAEVEATRQKLTEQVKRYEQLVEEQKNSVTEQKNIIAEQKNIKDNLKATRLDHLVAAYKGMKPERAGLLVSSLEDGVAVEILSAMPGKAAGQILAYVEPAKAARLTKAISERTGNVPKDEKESASEENQPSETPAPQTKQGTPPSPTPPAAPQTNPPAKPTGPTAKPPAPATAAAPKNKTQ